jgi:hypothetical protein
MRTPGLQDDSKLDSFGTPDDTSAAWSNDPMKKPIRKKGSAKRTPPPRSTKHASAKHPRSQQNNASVTLDANGKLTFNHAMVYVKDVERGLAFYRDLLGFKLRLPL